MYKNNVNKEIVKKTLGYKMKSLSRFGTNAKKRKKQKRLTIVHLAV